MDKAGVLKGTLSLFRGRPSKLLFNVNQHDSTVLNAGCPAFVFSTSFALIMGAAFRCSTGRLLPRVKEPRSARSDPPMLEVYALHHPFSHIHLPPSTWFTGAFLASLRVPNLILRV